MRQTNYYEVNNWKVSPSLKFSQNDLRDSILELNLTGPDGFEGFLAVVLGKISGYVFRLAGSGSQHGKDGEAVAPKGHISFEGKLYNTKIPKNEVLSKATEIIADAYSPDVWILGATIEAKTQILETLPKAFEKVGIPLVVLDWADTAHIPQLACACVLAEAEVNEFLKHHITNKQKIKKATAALRVIGEFEIFVEIASQIKREVQEPTLGESIADKAKPAMAQRGIFRPEACQASFWASPFSFGFGPNAFTGSFPIAGDFK